MTTREVIPRQDWIAVMREHHVPAFYISFYRLTGRPRAFAVHQTIYVLEGAEDNLRLMAHEFGHTLGLPHPPWYRPDQWLLNVMGYGLRILDPHNLIPVTKEWLEDAR